MTVSIARLSAQSGLRYLFKTTMLDDASVDVTDATAYYVKAGTPQGRWLGAGLRGIDRATEDIVIERDARALFDQAKHPDTGSALGRSYGQPSISGTTSGKETTRRPVVGFDLTFSVPKSVSVLWALSPHTVQEQILQTHHAAVEATLAWLEEVAIHTRAGRNGVALIGTQGAIAAAFDHWESRAGDPQLHTHMVIANRVQRVTDGGWVTLDSRTIYKSIVAASEHYNGLLFDTLRRDLGTAAEIRMPVEDKHNLSQQLTGVDEQLIREFSNRSRLIDGETDRLVAVWAEEHGSRPTATTTVKLRQQATLSTRTAKSDAVHPLSELSANWRSRAEAKGFDPKYVLAATIHRSKTSAFRSGDFTGAWVESVAVLARDRVAAKRATWNRWNLLAEAERVCAEIRCHSPKDRNQLIDAVATAAESRSLALNEYRYSLPEHTRADLRYAGHSVFDFHGTRLYTDTDTLANEDFIMAARDDDDGPALPAVAVMRSVTSYTHHGSQELHSDQRAAAAKVLMSGNWLDAVVGPAGTGKTTAVGAIKSAWEDAFGAGSVVGLAPAAASAEVLGRELAMDTENVAKWLYESVGQGAGHRATHFFDAETLLSKHLACSSAGLTSSPGVTRLAQRITWLAAEQEKWRFHANQLIVIDEASMVSTLQLAALVHQAQDAGAKILLVGDPAQLDAIDAGGILGWLDRQGKTFPLQAIWRFEQEWEKEASLKLRLGDFAAVDEYDEHQRIRHGNYDAMVDEAYQRWDADIRSGRTSILIAPDNDTVSMLNERAQADRVISGTVDAERTVPLSDGLRAGRGDTIIARQNDRSLKDSNSDFIRNGTLIDVVRLPAGDGSVIGIRKDTGATITLGKAYLGSAAELGYATTAHRSQGVTVDTGHTLVSQGRLTRELLYVSMTRGRAANNAYVSERDPLDHDSLDPSQLPNWRQILGEVLAAAGAERTAHEVRESESARADSLERLSAEYDYLAQISAADDLRSFLNLRLPGVAAGLEQSPAWGAGVVAWRLSSVVNRAAAERSVLAALSDSGTARDPMAIIHARLRGLPHTADAGGLDFDVEKPESGRPDLDAMLQQVRNRMKDRIDKVVMTALTDDAPWKERLRIESRAGLEAESWSRLVRKVAVFRDRWGIDDDLIPLGAPVANHQWTAMEQRTSIEREIAQASANHAPYLDAQQADQTRVAVSQPAALTNVGWQL